MPYIIYLDGVALPIAPSKMQTKIKNQNKTISLINDGEANILKDAGLTEITFEALIPHINYPFAVYPSGFKPAEYFLNKFEQLKVAKKPFQFICSRSDLIFDTNIKVSLEDYKIEEDASEQGVTVSVNLKQWKDYGTKVVTVKSSTATVSTTRPAETAPKKTTYTVKAGDTLWNISKKYLGNGARYTEIANLNKIKNPSRIVPGQVLTMPS